MKKLLERDFIKLCLHALITEEAGMIKLIIKYSVIMLLLASAVTFRDVYMGSKNGVDIADASEDAGDKDTRSKGTEKKIKHWVAPMDPTYIREKPGKSPMGMDLVPVYEDDGEASSEGVIKIDPVTVQNIGVRIAKAVQGYVNREIRAAGQITYDEELVEHVHSKVSGWIEKLFVDTTGQEVLKGQELLSYYSPDLVSTQEEYLQALRYKEKVSGSSFSEIVDGAQSLYEAAKKRLLYMDFTPVQINELEMRGEVTKDVKLYSEKNGIVITKNVLRGMKIDPMMELYTIADLSKVWLIASIYEYELPFIKVGQEAEMTLPYEPGVTYKGRVTFIYPYLSNKTRTVKVRIEFENPERKLKPDMYADAVIKPDFENETIIIPSESLLRTGARNIVITSLGEGKFLPKEVVPGVEGEGVVQILEGLEKGEEVVTSGQFLIDSESNLREAVKKMLEARAKVKEHPQHTSSSEEVKEKKSDIQRITTSKDQKKIISNLIDNYLLIHEALVSESGSAVAEKSHVLHAIIPELKSSDTEGALINLTEAIESSLEGLHSGDLQTARTSFKTLSRAMTELVRKTSREEALNKDLKIYFCPMENEPWMQRGAVLRNPYLGEDMWICGVEEKI